MPGGDGFAAVLHHPPFTSTRTVQAMLTDVGYTGIAPASQLIAMASGMFPALMAGLDVLVAVLIGVTVPDP